VARAQLARLDFNQRHYQTFYNTQSTQGQQVQPLVACRRRVLAALDSECVKTSSKLNFCAPMRNLKIIAAQKPGFLASVPGKPWIGMYGKYTIGREQQMRILLAGEKSIPHSIATLDKVHGVARVRDIVGWKTHT
jgi:hypothetical protein